MDDSTSNAVGTGPDPGVVRPMSWADTLQVFMNGREQDRLEWIRSLECTLLLLRQTKAETAEQAWLAHVLLRYVQADHDGRKGAIAVPTRRMIDATRIAFPEASMEAVLVSCEEGCTPQDAANFCKIERMNCGLE